MGKMSIHAGSGPLGHPISAPHPVLCNVGQLTPASYISQVPLRAGFLLPQPVQGLAVGSRGRGREKASSSISLSSMPSSLPTHLVQVVSLPEAPSFPWLPLWLERPALVPAAVQWCGPSSFCPSSLVVSSCRGWFHSSLLGSQHLHHMDNQFPASN